MERRDLIKTLATGALTGAAGCAGTTSLDSQQTKKTQTGPKDPVPGKLHVSNLGGYTGDKLKVFFTDYDLPRPVTLEFYRYTPKEDGPEKWEYYTHNIEKSVRPILKYDGKGTLASKANIPARPDDGGIEIKFPRDEPTGVPLIYRVELVEHTLDNQRKDVGYTPLILRRPDTGSYVVHPKSKWEVKPYDLYQHSASEESGKTTHTVVTTSTESRYKVPRKDGVENRSTGISDTSNPYTYGMYERPWAFQYTVSESEFTKWRQWNIEHYMGMNVSDDSADQYNMFRMFRDAFDDNEVLKRVAKNLNQAAENAGLTSPLGKLRLVADFVQRMPYKSDDATPRDVPNVKHPVPTLYDYYGDCEDKVILAASLLYQDAFPDYTMHGYIVSSPGHAGLAVRKDIFDVEVESVGEQDNFLYAEMTFPAPLGRTANGWSPPYIPETNDTFGGN